MRHFAICGLVFGCFLLAGEGPLAAQSFYFGSDGFGIGVGPRGYGYYDPYYMPYGYGPYGYGPYPYRGYSPYGSGFYYGRHHGHSHWGLILDLDAPYSEPAVPYREPAVIRPQVVAEPPARNPVDERPPVPTGEELARMSWRQLRVVLRYAIGHFGDDLSRLSTGAGWKEYLRLGALGDMIGEGEKDAPPDEASREKLAEVLERYDQAVANEKYNSITRMWGFRTIHATLAEYHRPLEQRQRVRLAHASRDLDQALTRWSTGHTWQKYLALPKEVFAKPDSRPAGAAVKVESLQKALANFDHVKSNQDYHKVAALPDFQATHELLREYLSHYVEPPTGAGPSSDAE